MKHSQIRSAAASQQALTSQPKTQVHPDHFMLQAQAVSGNQAVNQWINSQRHASEAMQVRSADRPQTSFQSPFNFRGLSCELEPHFQPNILIQTKLAIGQANDQYEQEADRMAAQVVNQIHGSQPSGQGEPVLRQELNQEEDGLQRPPVLQSSSEDHGVPAIQELETTIARSRGRGQPLAEDIRKPMEQAFGADFSQVRVHHNADSDQLNHALLSTAFTTKQDIFFRREAYQPGSQAGQRLMAHELTHVVQQNGTGQRAKSQGFNAGDGVVQCARGKVGRVIGSALSSLGIGDQSARMTFGRRTKRKGARGTPTNQLPSTKPYRAQDIQITSAEIGGEDTFVLRGREYTPIPAPIARPGDGKAVILLSGSGGSNEDQMEPVASYYCRQGATVYGMNYRGYGRSKHKGFFGAESNPFLSEAGLYDDAYRIYQYVSESFYPDDIVIHGFSLGGAVAANLAKTLAKEGVQLGGLVLHSSIKSAYEAARNQIGIPGLAQIAGLITKASAGSFDTEHYLDLLAERDPDLPIHFMSGDQSDKEDKDQLALSATHLETATIGRTASLKNVSSHEASGGHLDSEEIAVPSEHLNGENKRFLATLLRRGRNRVAASPKSVMPF